MYIDFIFKPVWKSHCIGDLGGTSLLNELVGEGLVEFLIVVQIYAGCWLACFILYFTLGAGFLDQLYFIGVALL